MTIRIIEASSSKGLELSFFGLDDLDGFNIILDILTKKITCNKIDQYEGPFSTYCSLKKNRLKFRLINHPDLGNSLCLLEQNEKDNENLKKIANEILNHLVNK